MTPFQPKGAVAEWRLLYDEVAKLRPDEVFTIEQAEEALGRPLGQNRSPVYRATLELERNHRRTLATVRGVGYRVALPSEHLGLGLAHSDRARTAMKRGVERAEAADRKGLTPSQARRLEEFEAHASRVVQFLGRMSAVIDEHSEQLADIKVTSEDTNQRVASLEEALKRHGMLDEEVEPGSHT